MSSAEETPLLCRFSLVWSRVKKSFGNHAAGNGIDTDIVVNIWMFGLKVLEYFIDKWQFFEVGNVIKSGTESVVNVMIEISNIVCQRSDLGLERGIMFEVEIKSAVEFLEKRIELSGNFSMVFDGAFQCFPGEVEAGKIRVMAFVFGDDAQRLDIMVESAVGFHNLAQAAFAGMAERRMPQIMRQSNGFAEFFIELEAFAQSAGDLGDLNAVGKPGAVVFALMIGKTWVFPSRRRKDME